MLRAGLLLTVSLALCFSAIGTRVRNGAASGEPALCDSCIWLVKTVRCEATDPDAQSAVIALALKEVCDKLGGELAAQCSQLVPQLVPVAIMMLGSYSAKELCADMSLCTAVPVHRPATAQPVRQLTGASCSMCKYLARSTVPSAHQAASLKQACANLPSELHSHCEEVAARDGQQLLKAGNSSEFACVASGACAAEALEALLHTRLPPLPAALSSSFNSLQTRVSQNQDLCDTCKLAVFEAAAILGNVETQKQILQYAKQMCSSLSTYHDQCLAYVELYGPLVFNMLVQYLTPQLCITLSYCPPVAIESVMNVF